MKRDDTPPDPMSRRAFAVGALSGAAACIARESVEAQALERRVGRSAAAQPLLFPISAHASGRYLVDSVGRPFPILGRALWFIPSLTEAEYHLVLDDTAARGYTSIEMLACDHDPRGNRPPFGGNGQLPFLHQLDGDAWDGTLAPSDPRKAPDFTTPNEGYWRHLDGVLNYAQSKGLLAFMFPAYVGFRNTPQGWMRELVANGPERIRAYGAWIASRYREQPNIVWMIGGDDGTPAFGAEQTAVERGLKLGLKSVTGASRQYGAEWGPDTIGSDQPIFASALTLNGAYSSRGDTNVSRLCRRAYASDVGPAFLLEEPYDEEGPDGNHVNPNATQPVRRFQWWGWLSSIGGYISGNGYVWPFAAQSSNRRLSAWRAHLDSLGAQDMARLNRFVRGIRWWQLAPSGLGGMRELVVGGNSPPGTSGYLAAAASPAGDLLIVYAPPACAGRFTLDLSGMHRTLRARWFDPSSGRFSEADVFPNTGRRTFVTPGANAAGARDWALLIEA